MHLINLFSEHFCDLICMTSPLPSLHQLQKIKLLLLALAHPHKRKIIDILMHKPSITVGELEALLDLEQAVVSQHLAVLRRYHILQSQKKGKQVFYALNIEKLKAIIQQIETIK